MAILWFLVSVIGAWMFLVVAYSSTMHVAAIRDRGVTIHWSFMIPLVAVAIPGLIIDVVLNQLFGWLVFKGGPGCWTFSSRVQWHYRNSRGRNFNRARFFALELNKFDADHIRNLDGSPIE